MKLKVLPPTLRKNNHYIVVDIYSQCELTKNEFISIVWDGCIRYFGECHTANFNLWIMRFQQIEHDSLNYYQVVIRCQRGFEDDLRVALTCVNNYKHNRISIITIGISGTIKSAVNKFFVK